MFKELKPGDKVLVPRTGGYYSKGKINWILNGLAEVSFPIGEVFRGELSQYAPNEMGHKVISITKLKSTIN